MDYEKVWTVNDMVKNRINWSLSADSELLKHLQHLSKSIIDRTRLTLELLESFENDVDRTCLSVANIGNRFKSLSDSQFIENKIQESPEMESMDREETKESRNKDTENVSIKLKEALNNGLTVLCSHYDIITVSDSDSENEEPQEILLKSCNPFVKRRLPYIIGTSDFTKYDHLGLADSSSDDEEDELADEVIQEEQSNDRAELSSKKNSTNIASAQIIQISSSDSDDSVISVGINSRYYSNTDTTTANNSIDRNLAQSLPKAARSFADHLNAALHEADVMRPAVIPDCTRNDSFSPPPFPVNSNSNLSSEEEKSDSCNSVSSHSSVTSRSSPCFFSSPLHTAGSNNDNIKSNNGITDELFSKEPSISKSDKYDEYAKKSNTFSTVGLKSELGSDLNSHEEKKLSRALADEFKSMILAKKNSALPHINSIKCNSEDPESSKNLSTVDNFVDVNIEKFSAISRPFHDSRDYNLKDIDNDDSDLKADRIISSNEKLHQSSLVCSIAVDSSKGSRYSNNTDNDDNDDDDDDDDNSDEWFNRAVSSKIPCNAESVTADAFKSSEFPSFQNFNEPVVKETIKDGSTTDLKMGVDHMPFIKKKSVGVIPQTKETATKMDDVEKRYLLFGNDGENADDDDDDDDLFSTKVVITSDNNKTNELYEILFNDSDIDDPIQALVEENKRRLKMKKSTESEIFQDSHTINKPSKDSEIADENYTSFLINDSENMLANKQFRIPSKEDMPSTENESSANVHSPFLTNLALDVNYGIEEKLPASGVIKTDESFSSKKIISNVDVKEMFSNDSCVSECQVPEFHNVDFEKEEMLTENVKLGSSESVLKLNASAYEKYTPHLSAETPESLKPGLDFLQSNSNKSNVKTIEKTKDQFENFSASAANSVTCKENNEDQQLPCFKNLENHDSASSISSQTSSRFRCDEFSPNTSKKSGTALSPFADNASNTSETTIHTDNVTNSKKGSAYDQNIFNRKSPSSMKIKPGKLAVGRGVNVNINALLPTSKWSKPMAKMVKTGEVTLDHNENDDLNSISPTVQSNLLSVTKNRVKISSKRRPPTRRGRVAHMNVHSFPETSVVEESEPTESSSNNLDDNAHGPNSVTFCDLSAEKWSLVEDSSNVNLPIGGVAAAALKDISCVGTSTHTEFKDVNSIFDTIFCNDGYEDPVINSSEAVISPTNVYNSSNISDILGKSSMSVTKLSSQEKKLDEKKLLLGDSENDLTSSLISDCKKIGSSNVRKIADSPKKSHLLTKSFDEDDFICANVSKNNENLDAVETLLKTGQVSEIEREPNNRKSDLFADDDDEDFNKLFSSLKKPIKNLSLKNRSLFADVDEDDEKLFGVKTARQNRKKTS